MLENFNETIGRLYGRMREDGYGMACHEVTFQVTEDCNLQCSYCYQGCKSHRKMDFETAKKVIDMIFDSDERTNEYIDFSTDEGIILDFIGGEPLLEVELIDQILDYFVEQSFVRRSKLGHRFRASMSSNGTLYFNEKVQRFIEKWGPHLSFSVSIDGNKELHDACRVFPDGSGSYDVAIKAAVDYMKKYGEIGSKMTIAPGNVMYLSDAIKGLLDTGYTEINCNCVYEKGWTAEHAKILYQQLKEVADMLLAYDKQPDISIFSEWIGKPMDDSDDRNWCGGTGCMLAVDWQGKFYPCLRYMGSSLNGEQEPYEIGDIESGIMQKDLHRNRVECLNCITRTSQSTEECISCPIASGCAWCSAYNYQVFGTPNKRATFICIMHKARVLANAYYWNKLYLKENVAKTFSVNLPKNDALNIISEEEYEMLKKLAER